MKKFKWELVEKKERGAKIPERTVSISKTCLSMSDDLKPFFADFFGVEIYLNRDADLVGLKPSNDGIKAFKIRRKDKTPSIPNVEGRIAKVGRYFAEWDAEEEKVIVDLNRSRKIKNQ